MSSNYKCCVASCKNNKYNVKKQKAKICFHKFPNTVEIRQKWIEFCRKEPSWVPLPNNVVCSQHFIGADYQLNSKEVIKRGSNLLNPEAIPSILLLENVNDLVSHPIDKKENKQYGNMQGSSSQQVEEITMYACAASFCNNTRHNVKQRNANIKFHTFPADHDLRRRWISFCKQDRSWKPSKKSNICSAHFKPEDYQLSNVPLHQKRIELRKLLANAVPSIIKCIPKIRKESYSSDETIEQEEIDILDKGYPTDPMLLKYRDQFCRTCLCHCKEDALISVDAHVQNMTVLEMLIQLTAFETENNDAFPTVICLECKHKLEQAFNVRQELILQAERLVQLVAEQKIIEYFSKASVEPHESTEPKAPEESIFTDMNQAYMLCNDGLFNNDNETSDSFQETKDADPHDEESAKEMFDHLKDHSCYTKDNGQHNHVNAENKQETCEEKSAADVRAVCAQRTTPDVPQSEEPDSWVNFQRPYEQEKVTVRKRKAAIQRTRTRKKQSKTLTSKRGSLEAKAKIRSESFPLTTCYVCDTKHESLMERDFHMREHIPMLPYTCKECNGSISNTDGQSTDNVAVDKPIVSKTTSQLNLHFRMHRLPFKCDKCYHRSRNTTKLKYHILACHTHGENVLTCEYCGKQYLDKVVFRTHVAHHRNEQSGQFKCTICDRSFGVRSSLQRHEASHKGERKYKCMYCDKSFSTSYNRLTHQRTHTGERPYECPDCDRSFSESTSLKAHREARHMSRSAGKIIAYKSPALLPSKGNRCPYAGCDYTASTYGTMYVHKRSKHRPMHRCEVCSKSFAYANQLKIHTMLHTGEKPHQCKLCERSFRLVKDFRWHMETHRSDSNYSCTLCQKSFKLQRYLEAHMLTHTAVRKFSCRICSNRYKTKGELKKHSQQKHSEEIIEEIIMKVDDLCDDISCATLYVTDEGK